MSSDVLTSSAPSSEGAAPIARASTRPPRASRWRRLLWGFTLPFVILGRTRASADDWAAWRRVARRQALATFVVGVLLLAAASAAILLVVQWARAHPNSNIEVSEGPSFVFQSISGVFALFAAVEWCVIALSREHHEQLTRRMSLVIGMPPEDDLRAPRVRLDLRWIGRRIRRWGRGVKALLALSPAIAIVSVPVSLFVGDDLGVSAVVAVWGVYWAMVLACAKSAHAWRTEGAEDAPKPWFVRLLGKVRIVRLYGRFVGWMSRSSHPPARELEPHGWEFLGLLGARILLGIPGIYAFARPTLPLAAEMILLTPHEDRPRPPDGPDYDSPEPEPEPEAGSGAAQEPSASSSARKADATSGHAMPSSATSGCSA